SGFADGMRILKLIFVSSTLVFVSLLLFSSSGAIGQTLGVPARITGPVDENNLVSLRGNVHPLARFEFDQGAVADAQPLRRMLLVLQRSPEQETALQSLLNEQQDQASPNYHAWL